MRAANRLNIAKAVKVASDRRRLGSPTEAEKEAWRQNLLRARQALHDDRTWKYATCFRHGLTALSLERSLVLAGESEEEYRAHLARFDRLVEGMEPGPLSDPAKLARATALVAWRRLRGLRLDREWTLRALASALQQAILAREEAAKSSNPLGSSLDGSSLGTAALDASARGTLAPDGLAYLNPDRLFVLGLNLESASCNWIGTWRALTRLNNRFDQLWCALVEELGELPPYLPSDPWWERGRMRPSPIVEGYRKWPVEVLGNPLRRPAEILARLAEGGVRVRPVEGWRFHPVFRSLNEADNYRWNQGEQRREAERNRLEEGRLTAAGEADYCLLGGVRRAQAAASGGAGGSKGSGASKAEAPLLPLPETFEEFLALVERAFGPEPPPGSPELLPSVAKVNSPDEPVDDAGRVRRLAELLWKRVERVRQRAEDEARTLARRLDAYGDALGRPRPAESGVSKELEVSGQQSEARGQEDGESRPVESDQRERLAAEILETFREKRAGRLRQDGDERVIRLAIYDLAVGRFGKQEDFELLKRTHDRFDQLHHEFFEAFFSQFQPARPDAGSG